MIAVAGQKSARSGLQQHAGCVPRVPFGAVRQQNTSPKLRPSRPRPPRGHAASRFRKIFVTVPAAGCYEPCRTHCARPTRYCSEACREALRRVRDRERKYLSRMTSVGRFKRHLEYQARARRKRAIPRCEQSAPVDHQDPTVGDSWESGNFSLSSPGIQEDLAHDSQGSTCSRSRAPPEAFLHRASAPAAHGPPILVPLPARDHHPGRYLVPRGRPTPVTNPGHHGQSGWILMATDS